MNRLKFSASTLASASTVLPRAEVIPLPTAKRKPVEPCAFTKATVRKLQCPAGRAEAFFWDAACRGFGVRALKSGRRSWVFQYRDRHGRTRRIALGDLTAVALEDAREVARRTAAGVVQGSNPSVDRRMNRAAGTVLELIEAYLRHTEGRQKPRSLKETTRHLRVHASPLHHERAVAISRRDIAGVLERIGKHSGPVAANRVRATLSALWTWGLRTGLIEGDSNPVAFTIRNPERARERVLDNAELKAVWAATANGGDYSRITRLCLLTGCRREEVASLSWDEIQDDRIVIRSDRMKGKSPHEIALLPMISAELPPRPDGAEGCVFGKRGTGYSGYSDGKEKLDAKLAKADMHVPSWGLHDLRRTFSTRMHDAGVAPLVVEALLAHKQRGVAAVYNRASFREAKRDALVRWHAMLTLIITAGTVEAQCPQSAEAIRT